MDIVGGYLRNIILNATEHTERVDAAVAYVSESDLLFDWCCEDKLPLHFWGRFDEQVPVGIPVLDKFAPPTREPATQDPTVRRIGAPAKLSSGGQAPHRIVIQTD
ncbi:hypothetical protein Xaut_4968 (plasmid) [Xanthobacter versatilis]|uniref:Uncharacterized protein n=1 Tax=Xanthobacter autotrophicus (strain ATCC BAA-1158 / Py2) TaxID=78245 RepID=A7IQ72_XANP2|nr:hypothetical protein Xaut_4968 [Xanthobacter autotrophicus Py2]